MPRPDDFGLSPRSRRLLGEALADWRHEVATAAGASARLRAHVLGTIGVSRASTAVVLRETATPAAITWVAKALALAVVIAVLGGKWSGGAAAATPNVQWRAVSDTLMAVIRAWPTCVFLAVVLSSRRDAGPAFGGTLACIAGGVGLGLAGSAAWRHYAEVGLLRPGLSTPGLSHMQMSLLSLLQLLPAVLLADRIRRDVRHVSIVLSLAGVGLVLSVGRLWQMLSIAPGAMTSVPSALGWDAMGSLALMLLSTTLQTVSMVVLLPPVTLVLWGLLVWRQRPRGVIANGTSAETSF